MEDISNDFNNEFKVYSTFVEEDKIAHVVKHRINGSWGVYMKNKDHPGFLEYYPTKSESWAEDCAENFVLGLKQI